MDCLLFFFLPLCLFLSFTCSPVLLLCFLLRPLASGASSLSFCIDATGLLSVGYRLEVPIDMGDPELQSQTGRDEAVRRFVEQLTPEEKMLVILKGELYEGDWASMLEDLRNRLAGRPYIFKLADRITEDINRIEKLQGFEQTHQVDLADYVKSD